MYFRKGQVLKYAFFRKIGAMRYVQKILGSLAKRILIKCVDFIQILMVSV